MAKYTAVSKAAKKTKSYMESAHIRATAVQKQFEVLKSNPNNETAKKELADLGIVTDLSEDLLNKVGSEKMKRKIYDFICAKVST